MEQTLKIQNQRLIDSDVHAAIRSSCLTAEKISVSRAMEGFSRLSEVSKKEADYHKSEYALCFVRMLNNMKPCHKRYTPTIIQVADWLISKAKNLDVPYRRRVRAALAIIKEKKLPIPAKKQAEWLEFSMPKRNVSFRPILPDPSMEYHVRLKYTKCLYD